MPCHSMTGFGQAECVGQQLTVKAEIRTVNHRFAEFSVRLPREYAVLEDDVRQLLGSRIARGRVDVYVTVENRAASAKRVEVDWSLYDALCDVEREALHRYRPHDTGQKENTALRWLTFPDVIRVEAVSADVELVRRDILQAVSDALESLIAMRQREGERLGRDLLAKADALTKITEHMAQRAASAESAQRERLLARAREFALDVDEQRLLTEVVLLSEKSSIEEELVRLQSHATEFESAVRSGSPIGRRLDFVIQEMHREVNTIGSKATDLTISRNVVEAKVLIEQLREQVQNLE